MGTRELIVCGDFNTECLIGSVHHLDAISCPARPLRGVWD